MLSEYLLRYVRIFLKGTPDPVIRNMINWHIFFRYTPATYHGFNNGLSRLVYNRRRIDFPMCDQLSDWLKSEMIIREKYSVAAFEVFSNKIFLLTGYSVCQSKGLDLPSIKDASDPVGVCDAKILDAMDSLDAGQLHMLIENARREGPDRAEVEYFLEREIIQFYVEHEGEIFRRFEISC